MSRYLGKNYELSRQFFRHYLVEAGDPLTYTPPKPVQEEIAKRYTRAGKYKVKPYNWGNPDIRNSLGHFDLEVIDMGNDQKTYVITDRYAFPAKDNKGIDVFHGFQVGKLSKEKAEEYNNELKKLGEYKRDNSDITETFELKLENGEYTFYIPQKFLADYGADYESFGTFETPIKEKPWYERLF